jgi:hypothetical protein
MQTSYGTLRSDRSTSMANRSSLKSVTSFTASVKNEVCDTELLVKSKLDKPNEVSSAPRSPSMSSVGSKPSKTSLKPHSGSVLSVKNETTTEVHQHLLDVLYGPTLYVSIYLCKDDSGVTTSIQIPKKSSSKSSVRSRCSKTSLKSNSGSAVSVKKENAIEVILFSKKVIISNHTNYCGHAIFTTQPECKPIQALPDGKITDDIKQSPKHSRKSSVVSKSSKTSLKSISASKVSIKNDTTTEVM